MLPGRSRKISQYSYPSVSRLANLQQREVLRLVEDSDRLQKEVKEDNDINRNEIDHRLNERIYHFEFIRDEIQLKKRDVVREEKAFEAVRDRVHSAVLSIQPLFEVATGLQNTHRKCHTTKPYSDVVVITLSAEVDTLKYSLDDLSNSLEKIDDFLCKIRKLIYKLDQDLLNVRSMWNLERAAYCASKGRTLSRNIGNSFEATRRNVENIKLPEKFWFSLKQSDILIKQGNFIRSYLDVQLKVINDKLREKFQHTHEIFQEQLTDLKDAKVQLENSLKEVVHQTSILNDNLLTLDKQLLEQVDRYNVCTARLRIRLGNFGKDRVYNSLIQEQAGLKKHMATLKAKIEETNLQGSSNLQAIRQLQNDIVKHSELIKVNEVDSQTQTNLLAPSL